jgi:hypothetical protein
MFSIAWRLRIWQLRSNSSVDRPALRLLHLSVSRFHHLHRACHCPPLTLGHVLRVDVHGRGDGSVPHLSLHVLRGSRQPRSSKWRRTSVNAPWLSSDRCRSSGLRGAGGGAERCRH